MTREEALKQAGAIWCHETIKHKVVDPELALVFAEVLEREVNNAEHKGYDIGYDEGYAKGKDYYY